MMKTRKQKSQFALEFTVLIAFMLLIFLGFFATTSSKILSAKDEENRLIAEELANFVLDEIKLAVSVSDGYYRVFEIPRRAKGSVFNISIIENTELVVVFREFEYVAFLPDNVVGNVEVGTNEIRKNDGIIFLSNIAECDDGIDNDGDTLVDEDDAGCHPNNIITNPYDPTDNDESNCGDSVCEGFESCLFCSTDCGTCFVPGTFILKAGSNSMSISNNGDVILKGILHQNQNNINEAPGQDEFIMMDSLGEKIVALVRLNNGNMFIKGRLFELQTTLDPSDSSNDFIVKNSNGEVVAYISDSGNFYLKGTLT